MKNYVLTSPNTVHMLWLLPQYVLLTLAELFVAITGYHFAYEQVG
jgi:solute carrier family 15 oligopeptide transporter 1